MNNPSPNKYNQFKVTITLKKKKKHSHLLAYFLNVYLNNLKINYKLLS